MVRTAFIHFENNYHGGRGGNHPTSFSNFVIQNVKGGESGQCGIYAVGVEGMPIRNVLVKNVSFDKTADKEYLIMHTEDFVFDNVTVAGNLLPYTPVPIEEYVKLKTD